VNTIEFRRGIAVVVLSGFLAACGRGPAQAEDERKPCSERLTAAVLDRSIELGRKHYLANQKPAGNMPYEYDWRTETFPSGDNAVRQAGALWGLALIHQDSPRPDTQAALERGGAFFADHSRSADDGCLYVVYPADRSGKLGTVALNALACCEILRVKKPALPAEVASKWRKRLDGYVAFLLRARTSEGFWHSTYRHADGYPTGKSSPYFDGESLLALVKAAKYHGRDDLRAVVLESAAAGRKRYAVDALRVDPDSDQTKGWYQWGSMSLYEIATSGWPDTEAYGDTVLDLADWMIDVHRTLRRRRNTAYAYEGIVHAYALAVQRGESARAEKFRCTIEQGLEKLTTWQIGSPIANAFVRAAPNDPRALGGVQNHATESLLRVDVVQHQMHAAVLARRWVFRSGE